LIFIGIVAILAIVEFKINFVEKTVGHYLNQRNQDREAWGRSWDMQRSTQEAAKKLDEKAVSAVKLRSRAELVSNFNELLNVIPEGEGVPISPDKFVELFLTLPDGLRNNLIETTDLVNLYSEGSWVRTSVWQRGGSVSAYLVDSRNRVLGNVTVSPALLKAASVYGQRSDGMLSDYPLFSDNIITASEFFDAFGKLPGVEARAVILDPDFLLRLPRPIIRVGLAKMSNAEGFSLIAFESRIGNTHIVTMLPVPNNSLLLLKQLLTKDANSVITDTLHSDTTSADSSIKSSSESVR